MTRMMWEIVATVVILLVLLKWLGQKKTMPLDGKHVLITGGSSGIGLSLAKLALNRGACVTLVARNKERLAQVVSLLALRIGGRTDQWVESVSLDISQDPDNVRTKLEEHMDAKGPVDVLINCAGFAVARTFVDMPPESFHDLISINYLGAVYVTKAILPRMLSASDRTTGQSNEARDCRVAFISSMAGQVGVFGYTGYSASKCALRGLAETLQMEVRPMGVRVTLAFPPDTDTPGFQLENEGKPEETHLISGAVGLQSPDSVASSLLTDIQAGRFFSSVGVDGWLLTTLSCGMTLPDSPLAALAQVCLMGLFRVAAIGYAWWMHDIVDRCTRKRVKQS